MKYSIKWLDLCLGQVTSEVLCSNWGTIYLRDLLSHQILPKVARMVTSPEDVIKIVIQDLGKFGVTHVSWLKFCGIEKDKICFLSFQGVKVIGKLFSSYTKELRHS